MLPTTFAIMPTPLANPSVCAASVLDDMASQLSVSLLEKTPQHIKTSEDPLYPPDIPAAQDPPPRHHDDNKQRHKLKILASNSKQPYALALHPWLAPDVDELYSALPERCFLGALR